MKSGVLKKGFIINNHRLTLEIPPNTRVFFNGGVIEVEGYDIKFVKSGGRFYAVLWGIPHYMCYDVNNPPYPLSFYK